MSGPSAGAVKQAKDLVSPYGWQNERYTALTTSIALALDATEQRVWEEAAKIAEQMIDPVPSDLTALSSQAAKFIAQLIRLRAAKETP